MLGRLGTRSATRDALRALSSLRPAGGVDQQIFHAVVARDVHGLAQAAGLRGDDGRVFNLSPVFPVGGRGLRVEVDHGHIMPGAGGRHDERVRLIESNTDDSEHSTLRRLPDSMVCHAALANGAVPGCQLCERLTFCYLRWRGGTTK